MRNISQPVKEDYPELKTLVANMFETMYASEGVGLAAPQIGRNDRIVVIDADPLSENFPECAGRKFTLINPEIEIESVGEKLTDENAQSLLGSAELVIDATDNLVARESINCFCVKNSIPWIYGGVAGSEGMTMNILPGHACFKCLMPGEAPKKEACADAASRGIISTIPSFISSIQCTEAIKILIYGPEHPSVQKNLIYVDLFSNIFEQHETEALPGCSVCGRTGG